MTANRLLFFRVLFALLFLFFVLLVIIFLPKNIP